MHDSNDPMDCRCEECVVWRDDRRRAVNLVLRALANPLVLMSLPEREAAHDAVRVYGLTVTDLIDARIARSQNT